MINSTKSLNLTGWECKLYDSRDFKMQEIPRMAPHFQGELNEYPGNERGAIWLHSFVDIALSLRKKDTPYIEIALSYDLFQ